MSRTSGKPRAPHGPEKASQWVQRFAGLLPPVGEVLDLACGGGRHSRYFLKRGRKVVAVDRDISAVADLGGRAEIILADLEDGSPFPLGGRRFAAVVVANYLHRPLLPSLIDALASEGLLIYDTFALGNEKFGRPANPDHLLRRGELLEAVRGRLRVLAYEDLIVEKPWPAAVQRICARRESGQDAAL